MNNWVIQTKAPDDRFLEPRIMVLLHGWTGDEHSMWLFTQRFPPNLWILAPRGPIKTPETGFGWLPAKQGYRATLDEFMPAAQELGHLLTTWGQSTGIEMENINIMGFSQGAAMTAVYSLLHPKQVDRFAILAGFLPDGIEDLIQGQTLRNKKIYIAHGTEDAIIPIDVARKNVSLLKSFGADLTYCESDIGHKLSSGCLKGLENFFFN